MTGVRIAALAVALAGAVAGSAAGARAEPVIGWSEPGQSMLSVRNNKAPERRNVRMVDAWEVAEYARFVWNALEGELVLVASTDPRAAIVVPWRLTDVPGLFHPLASQPVTWGASGRGAHLFGEAIAQRFTRPGPLPHCFAFGSEDAGHFPESPDLARRVLYGYACSAAEAPRETILFFANEIAVRSMQSLAGLGAAPAALVPSEDARAYALGGGPAGGLTQLPLGYARWTLSGGG